MNVFLDTSAIVKYFHVEEGTEAVTALVQADDNDIWVSELAKIEFVSAVHKKYRMAQIDDKQLATALTGFEVGYASFHVEPLGPAVTDEADRLLKEHAKTNGLRALDALQLAAFVLLADDT
jgi:predicted nucleic acid-binding protein